MLTFDEKIRALTALPGVSGREEAVRDFIQKEIGGCGRCTVDALGNLIVEKEGRLPAPARLMVTAHMDEVGFLLTHIEENGLLRFAAVGGVSPEVAARMGVAVFSLMKLVRKSEIRVIPPRVWMTFTSTPMPQMRISVPQGMVLMAFFSSTAPSSTRTPAAAKAKSPVSSLKPMQHTTMTMMAAMVRS